MIAINLKSHRKFSKNVGSVTKHIDPGAEKKKKNVDFREFPVKLWGDGNC